LKQFDYIEVGTGFYFYALFRSTNRHYIEVCKDETETYCYRNGLDPNLIQTVVVVYFWVMGSISSDETNTVN